MREVNPEIPPKDIPLNEILNYLKQFVQHPVQKIAEIPDWNWKSLFFVQITFAVVSGFLAGLIKFNFYRMASGLFLMPFVSTISSLLLTTFFYYYFQFFEKRTENFRKIFALVTLTTIPFYIFQIASEYLAPVTLIGFGFTSLLSIVGLTENFNVHKTRAYQIAGFLFSLVLLTWIINIYTV